jgi:hypothetical protein
MMTDTNDFLDAVSRVLWRCFFISALFLFLWAGLFFWAKGPMELQCAMFGLTPHECAVLHYGGMGLFKFFLLIFYLFPYIAIRLVLRKRPKL